MYCKPLFCKLWSEVDKKAFLVESKMYFYEYHFWYSYIFIPLKLSGGNGGDKISLKNPQLWPMCHSGTVQRTRTHSETDHLSSTHRGKWERSPLFPRVSGCLVICSWQLWLKHWHPVLVALNFIARWVHSALSCFFMKTVKVFFWPLYTVQPNEHLPAFTFKVAVLLQRSELHMVKVENTMCRLKAKEKIQLHLSFRPVV